MNTKPIRVLRFCLAAVLTLLLLVVLVHFTFPPVPYVGLYNGFRGKQGPYFRFYTDDERFALAYAEEINWSFTFLGSVRAPFWVQLDNEALLEHTKNAAKEADRTDQDSNLYHFIY